MSESDRSLRQEAEPAGHGRAMLELAGKAAGIDLVPYTWFKGTGWDHDGFTVAGEGPSEWNPLEDDGDALRLALRLGFSLSPRCALYAERRWMTENDEGDVCSATRRAIVRAAAAIGSEIQQTASGSSRSAGSDGQGGS